MFFQFLQPKMINESLKVVRIVLAKDDKKYIFGICSGWSDLRITDLDFGKIRNKPERFLQHFILTEMGEIKVLIRIDNNNVFHHYAYDRQSELWLLIAFTYHKVSNSSLNYAMMCILIMGLRNIWILDSWEKDFKLCKNAIIIQG